MSNPMFPTGWPGVQAAQKHVLAKKLPIQVAIRRLAQAPPADRLAPEDGVRAAFQDIRRLLDARESELVAQVRQSAEQSKSQAARRAKSWSDALERMGKGLLPPPPDADFESWSAQPHNAEYLQAVRTLQDAEPDQPIDEPGQHGLDVGRVEAAVRGLRIGKRSGAGFKKETYAEFVARAQRCVNRHDMIHAVRHCGQDEQGVALVQLDGEKMSDALVDLEALLMHLVCELDKLASSPYTVVLFQPPDSAAAPDYSAMYAALELYEKNIDSKYERNLHSLLIIHPSHSCKIAARFFSPFISEGFAHKVQFVTSLEQLAQLVPLELLRLPSHALEQEEASQLSAPTLVGGDSVSLAAGLDPELSQYLNAASSVLQESWRSFLVDGRLQQDSSEELKAALAAFDLEGFGRVNVEGLRYGLGSLGAAPLSRAELDQFVLLAGGGESIEIKQLCKKMMH